MKNYDPLAVAPDADFPVPFTIASVVASVVPSVPPITFSNCFFPNFSMFAFATVYVAFLKMFDNFIIFNFKVSSNLYKKKPEK